MGGIVAAIIVVSDFSGSQDPRANVPQNNAFFPRHCRVRSTLMGW